MGEAPGSPVAKLRDSSERVSRVTQAALEVFDELQNYNELREILSEAVRDAFLGGLEKSEALLASKDQQVVAMQDVLREVLDNKFPKEKDLAERMCDTFGLLIINKLHQ